MIDFSAHSLDILFLLRLVRLGRMRILFDHGTPVPWGRHLEGHEEAEAFERGWDRLSNGVLLAEADKTVFEMMITADKNSAINRT